MQEKHNAANRNQQLIVAPGQNNLSVEEDDSELLLNQAPKDNQNSNHECLVDPETRKNLTRRRLHELI